MKRMHRIISLFLVWILCVSMLPGNAFALELPELDVLAEVVEAVEEKETESTEEMTEEEPGEVEESIHVPEEPELGVGIKDNIIESAETVIADASSAVEAVTLMSAAEDDTGFSTLIANLPDVTDPMGTEYFFYNQLTDIEKVFYWEIANATWDNPYVVINDVGEYSESELSEMAFRALTALMADAPEYHMQWQRYGSGAVDADTFTYVLNRLEGSSEYLIRKADAKIDWYVATVGLSGDLYSRVSDLFSMIHEEMDYDPYYPFGCNIKGSYNDSALGGLVFDTAICAGLSDSVKILCDALKIPCIIVGNGGHAWNYILMDDGEWYAIDVSNDVPFYYGSIFGKGSGQYTWSEYHISDMYLYSEDDFLFPDLTERDHYNYNAYSPEYVHAENTFMEPEPTFVYQVNEDGGTCTITGYEGPQKGDLIIPSSIDGYTVTAIGEAAFYHCDGFTGNLVISDTVTSIGECAFQACYGLTGELHLSESLERIGASAFVGNEGLSGNLVLPDSLKTIDNHAFYACAGFTGDLILPDGIQSVNNAFAYCKGLDGEFYLPDGLEWSREMINATKISSIRINETNELYAIYDGVLYTKDMKTLVACPSGKTGILTVPVGVEHIGDCACYHCVELTGLELPEGLKTIGDWAFVQSQDEVFGISQFSGDLIIPDTVEYIGQSAFAATGFDGSLYLSEALKEIGDSAFAACRFNGEIYIPAGIESIGWCSIMGNFTNAVDLSESAVKLSEMAFSGATFPSFACNCDAGYSISSAEADICFDGVYEKRCNHCEGMERQVFEAPHSPVVVPAVLPTCTETGLTEGSRCEYCFKVLVEQKEIPSLGYPSHTEVVDATVAPTCTKTGLTEGSHCSVCGEVLVAQEVVATLGHTEVIDAAVAATCTETGLTEGSHCSVCGEVLVAREVVATLDHTEVIDAAVVATCAETGLTEGSHCSVCGEVLVAQEVVATLGHTEVIDAAVAATCTETGLTEGSHCSVCGEVLVEQTVIDALGHTSVTDEAVAPTCTTAGLTEGSHCSVCGEVLVVQEIIPIITIDISGDGATNAFDLVALMKHIVGAETAANAETLDVNGDDKVDVLDVVRFVRLLA